MPSQQVIECSNALAALKWQVAFAESATAGRMCSEFSLTDQSGVILKGGIVSYDGSVKEEVLGIAPSLLKKYTPESAEVTREMAIHLQKLIEPDVTVAITGLTTPGGSETSEKPVGTIFICILIDGQLIEDRKVFSGGPESIVMASIDHGASLILKNLLASKAWLQVQGMKRNSFDTDNTVSL